MKKLLIVSALLAGFAGSTITRADDIVIAPEIDAWVMTQPDTSITFDGEIGVGTAFPDTVTLIDVPDQPDYAFVVVNKKRVLVDRKNRTVVKIYQ